MRRILEVVERLFRHLVSYPLLRLLFHNDSSNRTLDIRHVKRILILRFDRIGDMIVTTPIFRTLKQHNPSLHIGVFTSQGNAEIISHNRNVDALYVLHRNWWKMWKEIRRARAMDYHVVLNFIFNRTSSAGILANLAAPRAFKVGQGDDKYRFYFNRLLKLERSKNHMAEVLAGYTEAVFGITIPHEELQFEIAVDALSQKVVDAYLTKFRLKRRNDRSSFQPYIVLNISTTEAVRAITFQQSLSLAKHIVSNSEFAIVAIGAPSARQHLESLVQQVNSTRCLAFPEHGSATLLQIASLVAGAAAVLTPDTSIIHFASATNTPVVGFFTPLQQTHEWMPYKVKHATVLAPAGKPVSAIPIDQMCKAVDEFLYTEG